MKTKITKKYIKENASENVICEMAAIMSTGDVVTFSVIPQT